MLMKILHLHNNCQTYPVPDGKKFKHVSPDLCTNLFLWSYIKNATYCCSRQVADVFKHMITATSVTPERH